MKRRALKSNLPPADDDISGLWILEAAFENFGGDNAGPLPPTQFEEELRLDVDGDYPQMAASGAWRLNDFYVSWAARLTEEEQDTWKGHIWYRDGDVSRFPYTAVDVKVEGSAPRRVKLGFTAGGSFTHTSYYKRESPYFYPVRFEYDSEEDITAVTAIQTHAHPNRPQALPEEALSIETVFRRAGFDVGLSAGASVIPVSGAGLDVRWSDAEMHDAMQQHWSDYSESERWAMWVFFASLHEEGPALGGIMFDDIGPQHRQGTAIFNRSFISQPSEGETHSEAWIQRMKFWTACHEIGHGFNLAHSWQKAMGKQWIPLKNEYEARSFMNYPYNVQGGEKAFFKNFEYRFTDSELLFLRHAPERFIKMGDAEWFDNHGFRQHRILPGPAFELSLRVNRETSRYEFLEPVVIELKLTNNTEEPHIVNKSLLSDLGGMTAIVKKRGEKARRLLPYASYLQKNESVVVMPGQSVYQSLFISAGREGWTIAEPGDYLIRIALHLKDEDIVSNELHIRVEPPMERIEEFLAQDFFSDEAARILYFDGSQYLKSGNRVLKEITERIPRRKVAVHAQVALALPLTKQYKIIGEDRRLHLLPPNPEEARQSLAPSLLEHSHVAANTLGHIDYRYYMERFSNMMAFEYGEPEEALRVQEKLYQTLKERRVRDDVLREIKENGARYKVMKA